MDLWWMQKPFKFLFKGPLSSPFGSGGRLRAPRRFLGRTRSPLVLAALVFLLLGCAAAQQPPSWPEAPDSGDVPPSRNRAAAPETVSGDHLPAPTKTPPNPIPGTAGDPSTEPVADSLWQHGNSFGTLFVSQKARRVGDIITIRIVESSSATNQATTNAGRNSSISAGIPQFFGAESEVPDGWLFNPLGNLQSTFGSEFGGEGTTKRSGDLTAYITAKVSEVLPNGNLKILGTREVAINNEKQILHLSGTIRSRDISTDNVILSTYIADAQITYSGNGVINDRQRPGWLSSLLNKIWPF